MRTKPASFQCLCSLETEEERELSPPPFSAAAQGCRFSDPGNDGGSRVRLCEGTVCVGRAREERLGTRARLVILWNWSFQRGPVVCIYVYVWWLSVDRRGATATGDTPAEMVDLSGQPVGPWPRFPVCLPACQQQGSHENTHCCPCSSQQSLTFTIKVLKLVLDLWSWLSLVSCCGHWPGIIFLMHMELLLKFKQDKWTSDTCRAVVFACVRVSARQTPSSEGLAALSSLASAILLRAPSQAEPPLSVCSAYLDVTTSVISEGLLWQLQNQSLLVLI